MQGAEDRRIAYAATATSLALPTAVIYTLPTDVPVRQPALLPAPAFSDSGSTGLFADAPPPMPLFPQHDTYDLVNFLVLGSDRRSGTASYRTDVIIVLSVNRSMQTVNLLSIPRDLYVYIPGWGMDRVNSAELHQFETGRSRHPLGLLAETIEYNLGLRIDHIARVDFEGFASLIDLVGGLSIPVDCAVTGFQPSLEQPDQWISFTLEPGMRQMDGALTLWYVRQRLNSSDFDRNRRQQIVLRALWHKLSAQNLFGILPELWVGLGGLVETDLTLDQALSFIPLLLSLDSGRVESHFIGLRETSAWQTPSGASVLLPNPESLPIVLHGFLTPAIDSQLVRERARINVMNASSIADADQLAAAQLQWAGLQAVPLGTTNILAGRTLVYDHSGRIKGSSLEQVKRALGLTEDAVLIAEEADASVDFTVVLGQDYRTCMTSPWVPFWQPD